MSAAQYPRAFYKYKRRRRFFTVKNKLGLFGVIVLTAVIGFSMAGCEQPGAYVPVDRVALRNAINVAQALMAGTEESSDGSDVAITAYWATEADHVAFSDAIATAQSVYTDNDATQGEVNTAVSNLVTAQAMFVDARQPGTDVPLDRTALDSAITEAQALLAITEVSDDGNNVATTAFWTTAAIRTIFQNAIAVAQGVYNDVDATQDTIDGATSTLAYAHTVFDTARQPGTYVLPVDRTALDDAITEAQTLLDTTAVSDNGNNIAITAFWTTPAIRATFQSAIATARDVYNNANATQDTVDGATSTLATAHEVFNYARQPGTSVTAADKIALGSAIANANALRTATTVSDNGNDVAPATFWTTLEIRTIFENAISVAQGVYNDADAIQDTVDGATSTLATAHEAFNYARQPGAIIVLTALYNAIFEATALINNTKVAPNADHVLPDEFWTTGSDRATFQGAIDVAQGVHDAPVNMATVNNAVSNLATAQSEFYAARQPGTPVDKVALGNAIYAASTLLAGVSIDGPGYRAPQSAIDAFVVEIATAQGVHGSAFATQAMVNTAVSNLATAQMTFNTAVTYIPTLTGTVTITGDPYVGQELTADTTDLSGTGAMTILWWRNETVEIGTGGTYILQDADAGHDITVTVTRAGYYGSVISDAVTARLREGFTISFADFYTMREIVGPTIHLTSDPQRATYDITVTNPEQYEANSIMWFFDGIRITGDSVSGYYGEIFTLGPRIHGNLLGIGDHVLTVEVRRNDRLYSQRIAFTVVR